MDLVEIRLSTMKHKVHPIKVEWEQTWQPDKQLETRHMLSLHLNIWAPINWGMFEGWYYTARAVLFYLNISFSIPK